MAHDAGVIEETGDIVVVVVRHDTEVEAVEGGPKVLSLAQDRDPGEAGLETLEAELLEEPHIIDHRPTPLVVVILVVVGSRAGPAATNGTVVARDRIADHSITPSTRAPSADTNPSPPVAPRSAGDDVC